MGKSPEESTKTTITTSAPALVICQEFLKVLNRNEVEQPLICQNLCPCAQFWRYQHYLLPCWEWGIARIVCLNLGSFRNVQENGGPFRYSRAHACTHRLEEHKKTPHTYQEVIRNKTLMTAFNTSGYSRNDPLQSMLRHVAAIEMASMLKFCSSRRGIEHEVIKYYFKKLSAIQNLASSDKTPSNDGENAGGKDKAEMIIDEAVLENLSKMPPTAGYAGNLDLIDIPLYLWDDDYTEDDKVALGLLGRVMRLAHLPPVDVVDCVEARDVWEVVDEHTLLYAVDPASVVGIEELLRRHSPAAMICRSLNADGEGDVLVGGVKDTFEGYKEFRLDKRRAPHTVGLAHLYIRRDIVEATEREKIVPPYPITFPHDYSQ
ncbi:hypothetical protein VTI28DRAFT_6760 [Corynascus sepedonium]